MLTRIRFAIRTTLILKCLIQVDEKHYSPVAGYDQLPDGAEYEKYWHHMNAML